MKYTWMVGILLVLLLVGAVNATTIQINASAVESPERHSMNSTFTSLRNGVGTVLYDDPEYKSMWVTSNNTASNRYDMLARAARIYDTSSIPDNATIISVNETVYGNYYEDGLGISDIGVTGFTPATPGVIVIADFNTYGNTRYATDLNRDTDLDVDRWNTWVYNAAGIANISKTGNTNVMHRFKWDIDNSTSGLTWSAGAASGMFFNTNNTVYKPYLTIIYTTEGGTAPVASFTKNATIGTPPTTVLFTDTSINASSWEWKFRDISGKGVFPNESIPSVETTFSTAKNATYTFGAGNFSIRLTATNGYGTNTTTVNTSFVNVSVGGVSGTNYNITPYPSDLYELFPSDHIFNARVDYLPLEPNSAAIIANASAWCTGDGGECQLWPAEREFINVVNSTLLKQNLAAITFPEASDNVPYPITDDPQYMWEDTAGEGLMFFVSWDDRMGYELYYTVSEGRAANGTWNVFAANRINYTSYNLSDNGGIGAAGVPQLPGIYTYEEVASGSINHSGLAAMYTSKLGTHVWPALWDGYTAGDNVPALGQRFRLNASFNDSGYTPAAKVILKGWKKYGFMLSDQNFDTSSWTVRFTDDSRWEGVGINWTTFLDVHSR